MSQWWQRMFKDCDHPHTVVITSVGVRRTVCERCGHISFDMSEESTPVTSLLPAGDADLPKAAGM